MITNTIRELYVTKCQRVLWVPGPLCQNEWVKAGVTKQDLARMQWGRQDLVRGGARNYRENNLRLTHKIL